MNLFPEYSNHSLEVLVLLIWALCDTHHLSMTFWVTYRSLVKRALGRVD